MTETPASPAQLGADSLAPVPLRRNLIVGAMVISAFMAAVEITVISTAMPLIVGRLGNFELFSWVFSIYLLAQAVMTPIYGKLADLYGRKRVYLASTAIFLLGSLLCGFAWSMPAMIAFRGIQGIGGAGLVPLSTIIISDVTSADERPRFMGYVSTTWGVAAIVGPLLGAFIVSVLNWSFVFWINLPIGLVTMVLVGRHLSETQTRPQGRIDATGTALLTFGVGAIMVALVQYQAVGAMGVLALVAAGCVAIGLLVRHERHLPEPMVPLHLWRNPIVLAANASALLCGAIMIGLTAFLPTYVQGVVGGGALMAGFTVGIMTVTWSTTSLALGRMRLATRQRSVIIGGSAVLLAGSLLLLGGLAGLGMGAVYAASACIGAGLGTNSLLFIVAVQSAVPWSDRGRATALFYFFRLFGQALGAAAFGGVVNAALFQANPGGRDVVRDLVEPARRAQFSAPDLAHWAGVLNGGLWDVFFLGVVLAVAVLVVGILVPRRADAPQA